MAALKVFYAFLIVLLLSEQGFGQPCSLSSISIKLKKTGVVVKGQPEWDVEVRNNCICTQSNVILQCNGFRSVEPVNPPVLQQLMGGSQCLLNNGLTIFQGQPLKFKFAGPKPTVFTPISSQINCS